MDWMSYFLVKHRYLVVYVYSMDSFNMHQNVEIMQSSNVVTNYLIAAWKCKSVNNWSCPMWMRAWFWTVLLCSITRTEANEVSPSVIHCNVLDALLCAETQTCCLCMRNGRVQYVSTLRDNAKPYCCQKLFGCHGNQCRVVYVCV